MGHRQAGEEVWEVAEWGDGGSQGGRGSSRAGRGTGSQTGKHAAGMGHDP